MPLWPVGGRADELLHQARQATFAVLPQSGPHATPLAVAWHGGRLWAAIPRRSLKAHSVRNGSPAAALVEDARGAISLGGTATLLDPARPSIQALRLLLPASLATARYLSLHARDTARIARDAIAELLTRLDTAGVAPRVLIALRPAWAVVLDGGEPAGRWGAAPTAASLGRPALLRPRADLRSLPRDARALLSGSSHAALTVASGGAPVVLPCTWDDRQAAVTLPPGVHNLLPRARGPIPASVTIGMNGNGLAGKSGVLLRGGLMPAPADALTRALHTDRAVWWRGHTTGQARPAPLAPGRRRHAD